MIYRVSVKVIACIVYGRSSRLHSRKVNFYLTPSEIQLPNYLPCLRRLGSSSRPQSQNATEGRKDADADDGHANAHKLSLILLRPSSAAPHVLFGSAKVSLENSIDRREAARHTESQTHFLQPAREGGSASTCDVQITHRSSFSTSGPRSPLSAKSKFGVQYS